MNEETVKGIGPALTVNISPNKVTKFLSLITIFLVLMDIVRLYFKNKRPDLVALNDALDQLIKLTGEFNLPTLFSALLLFASGILLFLIFAGTKQRKFRYHWLSLGLIFIFLSLDESLMIHESVSKLIRRNFTVEGSIHYGTWSIPYLIVTIFIAFTFLKFVLQLPKKTKIIFIVSGFVYVMGAAGIELAEGYFFLYYGEESFIYRLAHWSQEIVEMVGIIMFIYGLLDYLEKMEIQILFKNKVN